MIKPERFAQADSLIQASLRILVTTHIKPDGDAIGSLTVFCAALRALGKDVQPLFLSDAPGWYQFLIAKSIPILGRDIAVETLSATSFDLLVLLDVNSRNQLPGLDFLLNQKDLPILVIDHHATADHLGTLELVDDTAAATGLLVYELIKSMQWPFTPRMAEGLFVAAATDTGWFQFGNTDSRVYRDCADLMDAGAHPKEIYNKLYHNFSLPRFRLMLSVLNGMELHFENRFALQVITLADFARVGAVPEDTENLINECHRLESLLASVLLIETEDGRIRCSLRSQGAVDVSEIANRFGGGGHKMASGTFLPVPLEKAKETVLDAFREVFES